MKSKLQKVGVMAVLATTAFFASGMAHAGDHGAKALRGAVATSTVVGILVNGAKPADVPYECNVQGTNGWKVGGAGAAGAYAGNQIGGGSGKTVATLAVGFIAANAAQSQENERIRRECQRQIEQRQMQYGNNGYQPQPTSYGYPQYNSNNRMPTAPILYEGRGPRGPYYVTTQDSPGLEALQGRRIGERDVHSDPIVRDALDRSSQGLQTSFGNLEEATHRYVDVVNNQGGSNAKLSRYAVNEGDMRASEAANRQQQNRIAQARAEMEAAYTNYATKRAVFANISDNAAVDNYNITSYASNINYMTPPDLTGQVYQNKNRYAVLPNATR